MLKTAKIFAVSLAMMTASAWACDRPPVGDYDWVGCVHNGVAVSYEDIQHGLVDTAGNRLIAPKYRYIAMLNDSLFKVSDGEKWGVIDRDDRLILPMMYDALIPLDENYFYGVKDKDEPKVDLMDKTGKVILAAKYDFYKSASASLIAAHRVNNRNKYGVIDGAGNILIPFEYDFIDDFYDDYLAKLDNKVHLLDRNNRLIATFDDASPYFDDYLIAQKDGKWGVLDKSYQTVIPFMYDAISSIDDGLFSVEKDEKWGVVNQKNQTVVAFDYDYIGGFSDGLALVWHRNKDGLKYGYIDTTGKLVIDFVYDAGRDFHFGLAEAGKVNDKSDDDDANIKYGVIDKTGKFIIPPMYDSVMIPFFKNDGMIQVESGGKHGILDSNGKPVIDVVYGDTVLFHEGRAEVSKDGKGFYIDEKGKQIGGSWLIHEQACRAVQVGQKFTVSVFMIPMPYEVVSVDVERGMASVKGLLDGEMNEVACKDMAKMGGRE